MGSQSSWALGAQDTWSRQAVMAEQRGQFLLACCLGPQQHLLSSHVAVLKLWLEGVVSRSSQPSVFLTAAPGSPVGKPGCPGQPSCLIGFTGYNALCLKSQGSLTLPLGAGGKSSLFRRECQGSRTEFLDSAGLRPKSFAFRFFVLPCHLG